MNLKPINRLELSVDRIALGYPIPDAHFGGKTLGLDLDSVRETLDLGRIHTLNIHHSDEEENPSIGGMSGRDVANVAASAGSFGVPKTELRRFCIHNSRVDPSVYFTSAVWANAIVEMDLQAIQRSAFEHTDALRNPEMWRNAVEREIKRALLTSAMKHLFWTNEVEMMLAGLTLLSSTACFGVFSNSLDGSVATGMLFHLLGNMTLDAWLRMNYHSDIQQRILPMCGVSFGQLAYLPFQVAASTYCHVMGSD